MTYLAGLEAPDCYLDRARFREPHLSAIRRLNEHTADGFSFFAVRCEWCVSPIAPMRRYSKWSSVPMAGIRKLTETRREATGERDPLSDTRLASGSATASAVRGGGFGA